MRVQAKFMVTKTKVTILILIDGFLQFTIAEKQELKQMSQSLF